MCARWSPVLLSGDGHTSVRGRREAPRDEADLCWQLLLQLLCIFQFQVQSRADAYSDGRMMKLPVYTSLLVRLVGAVLSVIYSLLLGFSVMSFDSTRWLLSN